MHISKIVFDPTRVKNHQLELRPLTVLVGPHNSGKSQTLKDIDDWCYNHIENLKLVKDIEFDLPSDRNSIRELLKEFLIETPEGERSSPNIMYIRPQHAMVNKRL